MIASNVDKRRLDCPLFVFQARKLTAFWCKHTFKKAPKNRFLTAIRHLFIKKLGQMSGATPPDGDKNIAANARLEYNAKARQSNAIDGLLLARFTLETIWFMMPAQYRLQKSFRKISDTVKLWVDNDFTFLVDISPLEL